MVSRANTPHQVMDVGLRKRYKFFILLLLIAAVAMGYYLIRSHKLNTLLAAKNRRLKSRLEKSKAGMEHCKQNLKISRNDVKNFNDANKSLKKKLLKQESELALLQKNHLASETKLKDAFDFFHDINELVGNDQSVSEDHEVSQAVAEPLKKDLAHGKLEKAHHDLTQQYKALKEAVFQMKAEKIKDGERMAVLVHDITKVERQLKVKKSETEKLTKSNTDLQDTVGNLKKLIKKVRLDAMKAKAEQRKAVLVLAHTPPPRPVRVVGKVGGKLAGQKLLAKSEAIESDQKLPDKPKDTGSIRKLPVKPDDIGPVRHSPRFHGSVDEKTLERRIVQHRNVRNIQNVDNESIDNLSTDPVKMK